MEKENKSLKKLERNCLRCNSKFKGVSRGYCVKCLKEIQEINKQKLK